MSRIVAVLAAAVAGLPTGCAGMSNTGKGAGIGGAIGTGAGLAIGAATGDPITGAVAGGLIGAGTGAVAGSAADREEREAAADRAAMVAAANPPPGPLGIADVIDLSRQGVTDDVLVSYIRSTHSRFQLAPSDVANLHANRVSDRVITEMMNTRNRGEYAGPGPRTVVVREPPVVVYERPYWGPPPVFFGPPPPPPVGFGFTYIGRR